MSGSSPASYPAIWAEADDAPCAGSVSLVGEGLTLSGSARAGDGVRLVRYTDIVGVEVVRERSARLKGYPTLQIDREGAPPLRVSTIGLGVLAELNHLLANAIASHSPQVVAIVLPLRRRMFAQAEELVERGPPFDLTALGLERHEVLLSEREAIFLFQGPRVVETVQRLARDPAVWEAASGWARVIAGPPRLAEQRYGWQRPSEGHQRRLRT